MDHFSERVKCWRAAVYCWWLLSADPKAVRHVGAWICGWGRSLRVCLPTVFVQGTVWAEHFLCRNWIFLWTACSAGWLWLGSPMDSTITWCASLISWGMFAHWMDFCFKLEAKWRNYRHVLQPLHWLIKGQRNFPCWKSDNNGIRTKNFELVKTVRLKR